MPWSTQQALHPARKVAAVKVFSAYHGTHRGCPNAFFPGIIPLLAFCAIAPTPRDAPKSFTGSGASPEFLHPILAGLCHQLLSSASTTSKLHFPGPSKPPS